MSTKSKTENKPMPALMRKTKAQLVEIILRKDNTECGLRNDIRDRDNTITSYIEELAKANKQLKADTYAYDSLKSEFENTCDENASTICELKETISHKNGIIIKLCIGLIAAFVFIFCLCCL